MPEEELDREGLPGLTHKGHLPKTGTQPVLQRGNSRPSLHICEPSQCPVSQVGTEKCFAFNHLNDPFQIIPSIVAKLSYLFSDLCSVKQLLGRGNNSHSLATLLELYHVMYRRVLGGRFYYHLYEVSSS